MNERDTKTVGNLTSIVGQLYDQMDAGEVPEMSLPLRSKKNIEFNSNTNVWNYGSMHSAGIEPTPTLRTLYS